MTPEALLISRIGTALAGLALALFLITLLLTMQVENPVHPLLLVSLPTLPTLVAAATAIIRHQQISPKNSLKLLRITGIIAAVLLVVATVVVLVSSGNVVPSLLLAVVGIQNAAGLFLAAHYLSTKTTGSAPAAENN